MALLLVCAAPLVLGHAPAAQQALQSEPSDCECCHAQLDHLRQYCDAQKASVFDGDYELRRYDCPAKEGCCAGAWCVALVAKARATCCDPCLCLPECPDCARPPPPPAPPPCEPVDLHACVALALRVKKLVLALMPTGERPCDAPADAPLTLPSRTSSAACRMHVPDILELACEPMLPDAPLPTEAGATPAEVGGRASQASVALQRAVALAAIDQARHPRTTVAQYAALVANASKALPMARITCRRLLASWSRACELSEQPRCDAAPTTPPLRRIAEWLGQSEPSLEATTSSDAWGRMCPPCLTPLRPEGEPQCFADAGVVAEAGASRTAASSKPKAKARAPRVEPSIVFPHV